MSSKLAAVLQVQNSHQNAFADLTNSSAFQFSVDGKSFAVPANPENIWLAADLAVFNILLPSARGFIHDSFIPLPTARALKTCCDRHGK